MTLGRGSVVVVELDPVVGHERRGTRPCVVVSNPEVVSNQRYPLLCVVPVTGTPGTGLLYPQLAPGPSGFAKPSYALVDHLRAIDKRRIRAVYGQVAEVEMVSIDTGLVTFLGLPHSPLQGLQ